MVPKLEVGVVDQFDESDEQAPGVRSVHYHSLEKHPRDLLLDMLRVGLGKQIEHHTAEVVRVVIRVSQVIGNGIEEQVTSWKTQASTTSQYRQLSRRRYPRCQDQQPGFDRRPCEANGE